MTLKHLSNNYPLLILCIISLYSFTNVLMIFFLAHLYSASSSNLYGFISSIFDSKYSFLSSNYLLPISSFSSSWLDCNSLKKVVPNASSMPSISKLGLSLFIACMNGVNMNCWLMKSKISFLVSFASKMSLLTAWTISVSMWSNCLICGTLSFFDSPLYIRYPSLSSFPSYNS